MKLSSPRQAEDALARLFLTERTVTVEVLERIAFKDEAYLGLGEIQLRTFDDTALSLRASVRQGSYDWTVPQEAEVVAALRGLVDIPAPGAAKLSKDQERAEAKIRVALEAFARIAARVGLIRPVFDAEILSRLPFRRPATIVADTTGVLQGALDFVATYLQPTARIKVPGVLHMEVVNQADRFLSTRRKGAKAVDQLAEHLQSQTGQRALLRLELRDDTEVERNLLLSDPLRSAFREDRDPDLRELNLNVPLRSYVDRMILEAARQHQFHAAPGHEVYVLTSDQGLARMALAEGVPPLFFRSVNGSQFFGRRLSGSLFHPFTGELVASPLSALVWELATAFGRVRLSTPGGQRVEVAAIDQDLGWSAYHSRDDLLWFEAVDLPEWPVEERWVNTSDDDFPDSADGSVAATDEAPPQPAPATRRAAKPKAAKTRSPHLAEANRAGVPFYRFNVRNLVTLVECLSRNPSADEVEIAEALGTVNVASTAEYRRFLASGAFLEGADGFKPSEQLMMLAQAQRELDIHRVDELLRNTPSYAHLVAALDDAGVGQPVELRSPPRVTPSYQAIAEVTGIGAAIPDEGFFATLKRPTLGEFADIALQRFLELAGGEGWASVGQWLEVLLRRDGIHPVVARDLLREASGIKLRVATEGSTTDTRHDDHTLRVLKLRNGRPTVEVAHLYRGDFLIPDKSSTSLRLEALSA